MDAPGDHPGSGESEPESALDAPTDAPTDEPTDESTDERPVIVGVHRGQSQAVLAEAAHLAAELNRPLLCAYVAEDSYLTEWDQPDAVAEESLHPSEVGAGEGQAVLALTAAIDAALTASGIRPASWSVRLLAGDPAKALGRLASETDARLVVVGTHRRGFSNTLENWLAGSVGARLTHDQRKPVVVVPVTARDAGTPTLA